MCYFYFVIDFIYKFPKCVDSNLLYNMLEMK